MDINLKDLSPGPKVTIKPVGPSTPVGSHNVYAIGVSYAGINPAWNDVVQSADYDPIAQQYLIFQDGHPDVHGVNGITTESVLLVCAERLAAFQSNSLTAAPETEAALDHLKQAVYALNQRSIRLAHEQELKGS